MKHINLVYEDELSGEVMKQLLQSFGEKFNVYLDINGKGFGYIKKNISKFNSASKHNIYFVLTDLDLKECAVSLIKEWMKEPISENLIFRVAVREIEAWLLADKENIANFLGVSSANITSNPEQIQDPKQELINITKKSKKRELRDDIVPNGKSTAKQGPNYNSRLIKFIKENWDVNNAAINADSLKRAINALERI